MLRYIRNILLILCLLASSVKIKAAEEKKDSISEPFDEKIEHIAKEVVEEIVDPDALETENDMPCRCDSVKSKTYWIKQLFDNGFHINDSNVCYPAFPRFALKVYNWGDRTFNSYDKDYVVGTGKNWKLQAKAFGWLESQTIFFPKNSAISMHSNLFMDAGAYISFMAVSVGYMWNIDNKLGSNAKRHTFNFEFTCSRFTINFKNVSSDGGMILTRFGDYNDGHRFRHKFNDVSINASNLDAYYFFNHRKYSHAAAYSFSKYQLKSAGTPIAGFNFSEQNAAMNFSSLPKEILDHNPLPTDKYAFHYRDFGLLGGYGYNWAFPRKGWTLNLTATTSIGYKRTMEGDESTRKRDLFSNDYSASFSAVYNHRKLFASAQARFNGYLFFNSSLVHFSSYSSVTLLVGMRF